MITTANEAGESLTISFNSFPNSLSSGEVIKPVLSNFYAIVWLKRGKGRYFIDFKEYAFRKNSIVIISKNQFVTFELLDPGNEYVVITFDNSLVETANEEVVKLLSFCIREHFEGKQILHISKEGEEYLDSIITQLHTICETWSGNLQKASCFHLLQLVLLYCVGLTAEQKEDEFDGYTEVVGNFTSLLEANFRKTQKVNFYTNNLNLTYNSLARYTNNYCNKSPKEIITERLILEMKRLLAQTKTPIKQIAYDLGFEETTNFVKFFKKYTLLTPSAFRKQK